jgi:hypothetical protein
MIRMGQNSINDIIHALEKFRENEQPSTNEAKKLKEFVANQMNDMMKEMHDMQKEILYEIAQMRHEFRVLLKKSNSKKEDVITEHSEENSTILREEPKKKKYILSNIETNVSSPLKSIVTSPISTQISSTETINILNQLPLKSPIIESSKVSSIINLPPAPNSIIKTAVIHDTINQNDIKAPLPPSPINPPNINKNNSMPNIISTTTPLPPVPINTAPTGQSAAFQGLRDEMLIEFQNLKDIMNGKKVIKHIDPKIVQISQTDTSQY